MRILYRVRQFRAALAGAPNPDDLAAIQTVLAPALMDLFLQMQASEQAHSLQVYDRLLQHGAQDSDLLVAALLHDIGKTRFPLRIWERVVIVLAKAFVPRWVKRWGQGQARGWRRAFVVAEQHTKWGAEMAAIAGASPVTVRLIRRHQDLLPQSTNPDNREDHFLKQLQQFDDES